jgi:phosphoglycolate phosphatase
MGLLFCDEFFAGRFFMVDVRCGDRVFTGISAIVFDKDGTLADSQHYLRLVALARWEQLVTEIPRLPAEFGATLLQTWGLRGDRVDPTSMLAVASRRENEIVTAGYVAGFGFSWIEACGIVQDCFARTIVGHKQELTPIFPGALTLMPTLKASGLKLGILSADVLPNIQNFVDYYKLGDFIDFCQGAETGLHKPDPKLLTLTCAGLQVDPAAVLVIGDSSADIELARQGGAAGAIGVSWGWSAPFDIPNVDVMLRSIDQIEIV